LSIRIRSPKDFCAGLLFVVVGVVTVVIARGYPIGSTSRMGPGYFPVLIGSLLILTGIVVVVRGLSVAGEPIGRLAGKGLLLVLGAVLLFAVSIEKLGLAPAVLLVVIVSYLSNPRFKVLELAILAAVLALASVGIFVYGLKLPFKVWPVLG
jgi:putative tricarboxylic transport membrane protein